METNARRELVIAKLREYLDREGPLKNLQLLDPRARIGLRGSTATGIVKNRNNPTIGQPWNPDDYDLDLFIESDLLWTKTGDQAIPLPHVREALARTDPEVFAGLRPGGSGVSVRFFPSSTTLGNDVLYFAESPA